MWPLRDKAVEYQPVANDENELKDDSNISEHEAALKSSRCQPWTLRIFTILVTLMVVGLATIAFVAYQWSTHGIQHKPSNNADKQTLHAPASTASPCPKRREWRTLSPTEQQTYISAVLCLRSQPSLLAPTTNYTIYDDFPFIHSHVGYYTHHSASFLPWHRYFLHIYAQLLHSKCSYRGTLPYWDWTLDSAALEHSPVFSASSGFGGDGEVNGTITVSRTGRCVVDGPFAGVVASYYDVEYKPHCLSRGFRDLDGNLGHIDGRDVTPESIEEVLALGDYEEFVALMESRVHDAIPFGISGDFETFTAPYDPLFFLHHTQLDRLWWLWQQRQPDKGLMAYKGQKKFRSMERASLEDEILMKGLAPSIKVREVMDVEGDLLCYSY